MASFSKILRIALVAAVGATAVPFVSAADAWKCPAEKGPYQGQICQCLEARRPGGAGPKTITEFICPQGVL